MHVALRCVATCYVALRSVKLSCVVASRCAHLLSDVYLCVVVRRVVLCCGALWRGAARCALHYMCVYRRDVLGCVVAWCVALYNVV